MKKKINAHFILIAAIAIGVTLVLSIGVFYKIFQRELFDNLQIYAHVLESTGEFEQPQKITYNAQDDNLRITVVNMDGDVLYDSMVDAGKMSNHKDRPEIKQALEEGIGKSVRTSETIGKSTYYYAVLQKSDTVLRVAKETDSIWAMFSGVLPMIIGLAALLFGLSVVLSVVLTRSIVVPVEQLANDMEHIDTTSVYKELEPFAHTIQRQHEDIISNAQMRQEFTTNVSHELKTPLTSISGYSELIENGMATKDDVTRFAGEIHRNANRLLTLINDTIRLSELDVMERIPQMDEVDLYSIAQTCVDMLALNAEKHNVSLSLEGGTCVVTANREMMEELVYNLMDNAIRYNKTEGTVTVKVWSEEEQGILEVKDTGIGISKEHQQRIFERFYRVDKSRSKATGGTGLGLAIVKHIVQQHNAKIAIESETGIGTVIRVLFVGKK